MFARRRVVASIASLLLAGACFAAPALAVAGESGDAAPVAQAQEGLDQTTYVCGGLQCDVPGDYAVAVEAQAMRANNPEGTVMVEMRLAGADLVVSQDPAEWPASFANTAARTLEEYKAAGAVDAVLVDEWAAELGDGTQVYAMLFRVVLDDGAANVTQVYVPMANGSVGLFGVAALDGADAQAEADAIAASLALAPVEVEVVEAGGILLELPAGLILDGESASGERDWYSADGSFMVGVIPMLVEELSVIGVESLDLIATGIAEGLDGVLHSAEVVETGGATVYQYTFAFQDGGVQFAGALALVPLADDTVTGVLALAPVGDGFDAAGEKVGAIFGSIRLAEVA